MAGGRFCDVSEQPGGRYSSEEVLGGPQWRRAAIREAGAAAGADGRSQCGRRAAAQRRNEDAMPGTQDWLGLGPAVALSFSTRARAGIAVSAAGRT
jgi:hypothetical protein